jgi:predicted outer membrane repeat protein
MSWFNFKRPHNRKSRQRRPRCGGLSGSRLSRFEHLENRHLLAVLTVNTASEGLDHNDMKLSMREALDVVNSGNISVLSAEEKAQVKIATPLGVNDTIKFDPGVFSASMHQTIKLDSELKIDTSVTIVGPSDREIITLDGQKTSRIFNITAGEVEISGLTMTNGRATGHNGGAIISISLNVLTIANSTITNSTAEFGGAIYSSGDLFLSDVRIGGADEVERNHADFGGGVFVGGDLTAFNTLIINNVADDGHGGGIYGAGNVRLQNSYVYNNQASKDDGGGIYTDKDVSLQSTTVSDNKAWGDGGGIWAIGVVAENSTISGNKAGGLGSTNGGDGGGIFAYGSVTLRNSTVAHNEARKGSTTVSKGGGVWAGDVTLQNATVADNTADMTVGVGGGIFVEYILRMQNSIVIGNVDKGYAPDIYFDLEIDQHNVRYSLIGDLGPSISEGDVTGTQFEVLGSIQQPSPFKNFVGKSGTVPGAIPLAAVLDHDSKGAVLKDNNEGLPPTTETIKLIGVAIDKGSNALAFNSRGGDQRGLPFTRISPLGPLATDHVVDMGAFEVQKATSPNHAPTNVSDIPDQFATVGSSLPPLNAGDYFRDDDVGDVLKFSAAIVGGGALPNWLVFNPDTGAFSGIPGPTDVGQLNIQVTATDGKIAIPPVPPSTTFTLTVGEDPPFVSHLIPDKSATVGIKVEFEFPSNTFTDPNGEALTFTATLANGDSLPTWLTFHPSGTKAHTFEGTPGSGDLGTIEIKVTATDPHGQSVSDEFLLTVGPNLPPVLSKPILSQKATVGIEFVFTLPNDTFIEPEDQNLIYTATLANGSPLPVWLTTLPNGAAATFRGTPHSGDAGAIDIKVVATDPQGHTASDVFSLTTHVPDINVRINNVSIPDGGTTGNIGGSNGEPIIIPVIIQNIGDGPLKLASPITVTGTNKTEFVVTQPASSTVDSHGQAIFGVTFTPTGDGTRTATLLIESNDGDESPYEVTVLATGFGFTPTPEINVQLSGSDIASDGSVTDFGTSGVSVSKTFTIENKGTAELKLTGVPRVAIAGSNTGDFQVTVQPAASVPTGGSTTFTVVFTPKHDGIRTAYLTVANNDASGDENPYIVDLKGFGVLPTASGPSSLFSEDFNDLAVDPRLVPQSGSFALAGTAYAGTRTVRGQNTVAAVQSLILPAHYRVDATINMAGGNGSSLWSNGLIIFDYVDANNFKYAGAFEIIDSYIIGQVVNGHAAHLAKTRGATLPNTNVNLSLDINGSVATLSANGSQVVSRSFKSAFAGKVGVGTLNANTVFDNIFVTPLS